MIIPKQDLRIGEIRKTTIKEREDSMERIQKLIAQAGITSRRKAEELILAGRVTLNGEVVKELGTKADVHDTIEVDGKPIRKEEKVYFLLNKPKQCLSSVSDERGRKTVIDYLPGVNARVYPVGRLDYETTGVLILTNDGAFANKMMHPRFHLNKKYECTINGVLSDKQVEELKKGIELEDGMTLPAKVQILQRSKNKNKTIFEITIFEGRNREIRRMMEHFGYRVTRLERLQYGNLDCKNLRQGEYRRLRSYEIRSLLKFVNEGEFEK